LGPVEIRAVLVADRGALQGMAGTVRNGAELPRRTARTVWQVNENVSTVTAGPSSSARTFLAPAACILIWLSASMVLTER
jgi:hypothetical protein